MHKPDHLAPPRHREAWRRRGGGTLAKALEGKTEISMAECAEEALIPAVYGLARQYTALQ